MQFIKALSLIAIATAAVAASSQNRPPAIPLIAHDPYFSIWSVTNNLADEQTRHWTGSEQPLASLVRIDGKPFRLMGKDPADVSALPQLSCVVYPTRTVYTFGGVGTELTLTFTTPSLPEDLDVFSRPATYVTWSARSTDGKSHTASVYFDASAMLAVNRKEQAVTWSRGKAGSLTTLRIGSEEQPVLEKSGDDLRIDWGHLYVAGMGKGFLGSGAASLESFYQKGTLPAADEPVKARPAGDGTVAAFVLDLGKLGARPVAKHLVVAYDDEYSIQYFDRNLRPYWRRNGLDAPGMLALAEKEYASLSARCEAFDAKLLKDLDTVGGKDYAYIASLAFRQSFAAQKLVADLGGAPLMFSKENFSNGCIATVDILYPEAPQLLLLSPTLMKASMVPVLEYASSPRWKWPFAPHDLGTYPKANGQVYGGGERTEENQMPVEESGNMLILLAALAKEEGRGEPDAGGGVGQYAHPAGGAGEGRGERRLRRQVLAGAGEVGCLPYGQGLRPGEPTLHR